MKFAYPRERFRVFTQLGFFVLFLTAPFFDIFRLDLTLGHFIIFGYHWTLGLEMFQQGQGDALQAASTILLHVFVPVLGTLAVVITIIWKYGRVYCGWFCPHFSVVEIINNLMYRFLYRVTLWEKPTQKVEGIVPWLIVIFVAVLMAFIWAFSLLSYLLPPKDLIYELLNNQLGRGSTWFLVVATIALSIDFIFARHLFCRFGCAIGLAQSVVWMGNQKAMVVSFEKKRAEQCRTCDNQCDFACPMRLFTRGVKRAKFTCTQCGQCLSACDRVQEKNNYNERVIHWVSGNQATQVDKNAIIRKQDEV